MSNSNTHQLRAPTTPGSRIPETGYGTISALRPSLDLSLTQTLRRHHRHKPLARLDSLDKAPFIPRSPQVSSCILFQNTQVSNGPVCPGIQRSSTLGIQSPAFQSIAQNLQPREINLKGRPLHPSSPHPAYVITLPPSKLTTWKSQPSKRPPRTTSPRAFAQLHSHLEEKGFPGGVSANSG